MPNGTTYTTTPSSLFPPASADPSYSGGVGAGTGSIPWWQSALGMGMMGAGAFMGKDPYSAASGTLEQIPSYFEPYYKAGVGELPKLQHQYGQLTQDPGALEAQLGSGYKASPGYGYNVSQATSAANQAAAAGGMAGSPQEQQQLAQTITGMSSQDYQEYMQRILGMYGMGLQGEQGLAQTGMRAGEDTSDALLSQAQMQYASQQAQNQKQGGGMGALGGLLAAGMLLL